ncbi:hypothetical protein DFH09DRAFT_1463860 [Mycena vulgaris]|nr:hypothetical protein DFH09DRAFT_1463860 [Mycena vulgaris]
MPDEVKSEVPTGGLSAEQHRRRINTRCSERMPCTKNRVVKRRRRAPTLYGELRRPEDALGALADIQRQRWQRLKGMGRTGMRASSLGHSRRPVHRESLSKRGEVEPTSQQRSKWSNVGLVCCRSRTADMSSREGAHRIRARTRVRARGCRDDFGVVFGIGVFELAWSVWFMEFGRVMGFFTFFSGNQLGGHQNVWGFTDYGFWQLWVKTASTVDDADHRRTCFKTVEGT